MTRLTSTYRIIVLNRSTPSLSQHITDVLATYDGTERILGKVGFNENFNERQSG